MNVAGPSQPRAPRPLPIPRGRDVHEEDLTRMIAELGLSDVERLQTFYDNREHRGKAPSDREVAFTLLMQNARELAEFNADLAFAQRLADGGNGEPDPTPSRRTTMIQKDETLQPDIRKYAYQRYKHGLNCLTPFFRHPYRVVRPHQI